MTYPVEAISENLDEIESYLLRCSSLAQIIQKDMARQFHQGEEPVLEIIDVDELLSAINDIAWRGIGELNRLESRIKSGGES